MDGIGLGSVINRGWEAFKKHMAVAIIAFLIYGAIIAVAGYIPVLNIVFYIVAMFPLVGGLNLLTLRIVKDENPQIGDLFEGFNDLVRWMGVGWLLTLYMAIPALACAVPVAIGTWLMDRGFIASVIGVLFVLLGVILAIVIIVVLYLRWVFVYFVAAEEGLSAGAALQRSTSLTKGIRLPLLGYLIVIGIIGWAGVIALGVGVLFTAPLASCAFAVLYLEVKNRAVAQPAVHTQLQPELDPGLPASDLPDSSDQTGQSV